MMEKIYSCIFNIFREFQMLFPWILLFKLLKILIIMILSNVDLCYIGCFKARNCSCQLFFCSKLKYEKLFSIREKQNKFSMSNKIIEAELMQIYSCKINLIQQTLSEGKIELLQKTSLNRKLFLSVIRKVLLLFRLVCNSFV